MSMINPEYQPGLFSQNEQGSVDVLGINSVTDAVQEMNNGLLHDVKLVSEKDINKILDK